MGTCLYKGSHRTKICPEGVIAPSSRRAFCNPFSIFFFNFVSKVKASHILHKYRDINKVWRRLVISLSERVVSGLNVSLPSSSLNFS